MPTVAGNRLSTMDGVSAVYNDQGELTEDPRGYLIERAADGRETFLEDPAAGLGYDVLRDPDGDPIGVDDGTDVRAQGWGNPGADLPLWVDDGVDVAMLVAIEGLQVGRLEAGGTFTPVATDGQGSVVLDGSAFPGVPEAFGVDVGAGAMGLQRHRFAGLESLPGMPFQLARARVMDPTVGRFVWVDPIGLDGGDHRFLYAENQPTGFVDPGGRQAWRPPAGYGSHSAGILGKVCSGWTCGPSGSRGAGWEVAEAKKQAAYVAAAASEANKGSDSGEQSTTNDTSENAESEADPAGDSNAEAAAEAASEGASGDTTLPVPGGRIDLSGGGFAYGVRREGRTRVQLIDESYDHARDHGEKDEEEFVPQVVEGNLNRAEMARQAELERLLEELSNAPADSPELSPNPVHGVQGKLIVERRGELIQPQYDAANLGLDGLQMGLGVAGLFPGAGEAADGASMVISLARGDVAGAALDGASMVPGAGWGPGGTKIAVKAGNIGTGVRQWWKGVDGAAGVVDDVPGVASRGVRGGETAATKAGREAHKGWDPGPGFDKEVTLPSGRRADAVNPADRVVKELKPNNPRAVRAGEKQVDAYRTELEEMTGETWTGVVETYEKAP